MWQNLGATQHLKFMFPKRKYFSSPNHEPVEILILAFGQKRKKSEFVTKFAGVVIKITFIENYLRNCCKIFCTVFFH